MILPWVTKTKVGHNLYTPAFHKKQTATQEISENNKIKIINDNIIVLIF